MKQLGPMISMAYGTLTTIMYVTCLIKVSEMMQLVLDPTRSNRIDTAAAQQVSRDWLVQPFTDIIVTTADYCPTSHPDLVYTRTFLGT